MPARADSAAYALLVPNAAVITAVRFFGLPREGELELSCGTFGPARDGALRADCSSAADPSLFPLSARLDPYTGVSGLLDRALIKDRRLARGYTIDCHNDAGAPQRCRVEIQYDAPADW